MNVTLEKSGGLLVTQPPIVLSADKLTEADRKQLENLLAVAARDCEQSPEISRQGGDIATYTITVERQGAVEVLRRSDADMVQAFAELKRWIELRARTARGR